MARITGNTSEVCKAWANGDDNPYRNQGDTVYFDGDTIYSYGSHFKMGIKRNDGTYILNGDRYSNTTSNHQAILRSAIIGKQAFTTSFQMLSLAGLNPRNVEIVDYEPDKNEIVIGKQNIPAWSTDTRCWNTTKWDYKGNEPVEIKIPENEREYHCHRTSTVVFLNHDDDYYICGMDERSYFVSKLPHAVNSVAMAFEALKPSAVIKFEKSGAMPLRQGEWFFCDITDSIIPEGRNGLKTMYNKMAGNMVLPLENELSNPHTVDRGSHGAYFSFNDSVPWSRDQVALAPVVSGRVRHPEHSTLRLCDKSEPRLFASFRNTAIANWSSGVAGIGVD